MAVEMRFFPGDNGSSPHRWSDDGLPIMWNRDEAGSTFLHGLRRAALPNLPRLWCRESGHGPLLRQLRHSA